MPDDRLDEAEELERQVRALDRRVRRHKLGVERLNPLEAPDEHARRFEELVALEVELRDLRARLAAATGDGVGSLSEDG